MTTAEKFTAIADAIRVKTGKTDEIVANDFAAEILSIDRLQPMTLYPNELDNGYYGNCAAIVAATYHHARNTGRDNFVYNSKAGIFGGANPRVRDTAISLTNSEVSSTIGFARIDCSTFISLVLRGIAYRNSPYAVHPYNADTENRWIPATELADMYGTAGWEIDLIDKQPEGVYNNIGICGYSTLRTAGDFGEFLYKYAKVLYDSSIDEAFTAETAAEFMTTLRPGDIIMWSKVSASETQKKRFRSISHIAIVAERTDRYFHVSGGSTVVLYEKFTDTYPNISLICRPDYRPLKQAGEIPIGFNVLHYPWSYSVSTEHSDGGITLTLNADEITTINLSGTSTEDVSFAIKGHDNNECSCITLCAGTYELSGMDDTGVESTAVALQLRYADGSEFEEKVRCYAGHNPTVTLDTTTDVVVRLYVSAGYTLDCVISPTLKRLS